MAQNNSGDRRRQGRRPGLLRQSSGSTSPQALTISFASELRAHRGKLDFGPGPGDQVFAASFLTRREVVLDLALLEHAPSLVNIFAHEVYHFVWRRLPNAERQAWSQLLAREKAPIHPGLSSRLRYESWQARRTERRWKDYQCEAFCDSAAALTDPNAMISPQRRRWLGNLMKRRSLPV